MFGLKMNKKNDINLQTMLLKESFDKYDEERNEFSGNKENAI